MDGKRKCRRSDVLSSTKRNKESDGDEEDDFDQFLDLFPDELRKKLVQLQKREECDSNEETSGPLSACVEEINEDNLSTSVVEESPIGAAMNALNFLNDPENIFGFDFFANDGSFVADGMDGALGTHGIDASLGTSPPDASVGAPPPDAHRFATVDPYSVVMMKMPAKKGVHPVYIHRLAYCKGCQRQEKYCLNLAIRNGLVKVHPESLPHVCSPLLFTACLSERKYYEITESLGRDADPLKPLPAFRKMLASISEDKNLTTNEKLVIGANLSDFQSRRRGLSKARSSNKRQADAIEIEEKYKLSLIPSNGGEMFVHLVSEEMVLCFSKSVVQLAVSVGITHIISDGCHSAQPAQFGKNGQLYSIHGLTPQGAAVGLMHIFLSKKTKDAYGIVFRKLQELLVECGADPVNITFVIDYEAAAIAVIRKIFNGSPLQGCSFHYSMAINRRARKEGITLLAEEYPEIKKWYSRILALVFLPADLLPFCSVLKNPVGKAHKARAACRSFLDYFQSVWMKTYHGMWNKFLQEEHRTTNLAEAFHSSLQKELCKHGKNPPVSAVLEILQETQLLRYYDLVRCQRGTFNKKLRPEDKQRREAIDKAMKDFDDLKKNSDPSEDDIFKYLDSLSHFLSRKCF